MASKPLVVVASLVALGGAALIGLGPRFQSTRPAVAPEQLSTELEARVHDAATGVHARADTLAGLPSVRDGLSTNADTMRDQTTRERMVRANPGETITIAQVLKAGGVEVLLVLPDGAKPEDTLDKSGPRVAIKDHKLYVSDVLPVTPSEAERAAELRGALAVSWLVDLTQLTEHLDALGASAQISIGSGDLRIGAATPNSEPVPLHVGNADMKVTAWLPMIASGPPLRTIGGVLVALGVMLLGIGLRRTQAVTNAFALTAPAQVGTAASIHVGTLLDGTYEISGLLGKGGMGTVWQAKHTRLPDKRVAIKVLSSDAAHPELLARFRREAEITSKLGHPNIVGVMDFNTLPSGVPYIVLEYLEGESLAARISRGPIMLDQSLEFARQIASALHAAHKAGIVHRDLKPDNVFLVPTESGAPLVKVLDFGISKLSGGVTVQTQDSTILGTPQYMSPEQANGKNSEVDPRSDVWALGAIVYEMITSEQAFTGDSMTVLLVNVLVNPSPSLRSRLDVPHHVVDAIDRALAKEPNERWPDMPSFIAALTGSPLPTVQRTIVD